MKLKRSEKIVAAYLAWWGGGISSSRLAKALNVTREHASRKIMPWARQNLALSEPDGSQQIMASSLVPEKLPEGIGSPRVLLDTLPGIMACLDGNTIMPNVTRLSEVTTAPCDPEIFRALFRAQTSRRAVLIDYRAKSGPRPMWFSPHSLVETSHRIHFRGHAQWLSTLPDDHTVGKRALFYDIVPTRIAAIEGESDENYVSDDLDVFWHETVDAVFTLSDELPQEIRSAIIQEWGPLIYERNGKVILLIPNVRKALLQYVSDDLRVRVFQGKMYEIWIPLVLHT